MILRNVFVFEDNKRILKNIYITPEGCSVYFSINEDLSSYHSKNTFDAKAKYTLMPGLLDAHVHGHGGYDFADVGHAPHTIPLIMQALGQTGLSYAMATLISLDLKTLENSLLAIDDYVQAQEENIESSSAKIVGVHLEGPFIAKNCKGAHAEEHLQEKISMELFTKIISVAPNINNWKLTLAPDLPGAEQFIKDVKKLESKNIFVNVSLGHSNPADKSVIGKAIAAGAIGFTHLGNACGETCCREARRLDRHDPKSQLVQWVLENPQKCPAGVELFIDGVHLSKSFVRLLKDTLGDKLVLITDALGPSGCDDGLYESGKLFIRKNGNTFYLADANGHFKMKEMQLPDGSTQKEKILAGSGVSLVNCIQQYAEWLSDIEQEQKMQSIYAAVITNPRQSSLSADAIVNLPDKKNFVLIDEEGKLVLSLCHGQLTRVAH